MDAGSYPTTRNDLAVWARQNKTTMDEARRRFVQFVVLMSMSSSPAFVTHVAFKGGNALRFVHGNLRSTLDLDFSADADFPDNQDDIKSLMDAALASAERRYQVKARCQSIHRKPSGHEKTRPTYSIKVCYQLAGDKHYQNFAERKAFPEVVEIEISLNDVLCETAERVLEVSAKPLRVCTLEDILAEKLRALLQQIPRKRSRPQDVFDIASMVRRHGGSLDVGKVSIFLVRKSEAREIVATKGAFDGAVRERASVGYESEIRPFTTEFIPFDEAWGEVLGLVARLDIPE